MKLETPEAKEARKIAKAEAHKKLEAKKEAERIQRLKDYEKEKEEAMLASAKTR